MKKTILSLILVLTALQCGILHSQDHNLIPAPGKAAWGKDKFHLNGAKILLSADLLEREQATVKQLISFIKESSGITINTTYAEEPGVKLIVLKSENTGPALPVQDEKTGPGTRESYQISVTGSRVLINAKTDAGVFYAIQTLEQMAVFDNTDSYIPEAEIEDYPEMAYRGVMIDFSHGGLLTEAEIMNQIDFLARWKMNQYYFYNEVSIEMKGYSLINYNACYSQEQISRIVAYARKKHIDVIPFVNFYGHLHELLRVEKYAGLGIGKYGHDLDPRDPGVQIFLKDWIKQYTEIFPSPFIHIGFDETWETERLKTEDKSIQPKELYLTQIDFVTKTLRSYGKRVMVWTDISNNYPDIISQFPRDLIPVLWEYSDTPGSLTKWLTPVKKEKLPFFVQSAVDNWGNVYPAADYTFDNIDICLKACKDENAIGYITSVWTDAVQPLLRNSWLFMAYGSAGAWQSAPIDKKSFTEKYCRIMYPGSSEIMRDAFLKMSESEDFLAKCLGRHTLSEMWEDPFSSYHLNNTAIHLDDFRNARIAAEEAQEKLYGVLLSGKEDTAFIRTMLVNCRQLDFTAARFIWAKTIVDRWNWIYDLNSKGEKDYVRNYDINYTTHGLIADMMDYCTTLREEYRKAWLSENMSYRLGTMTGRFDSEYLLWRNLHIKIGDYINHNEEKTKRSRFEKLFLNTK
ncbi:MAG: beta-N-acetylhexosaminidase [Bacteroidales bacterium]|nr:beta-N-acetylhexosaminidase [Bacteroidales bacterium]